MIVTKKQVLQSLGMIEDQAIIDLIFEQMPHLKEIQQVMQDQYDVAELYAGLTKTQQKEFNKELTKEIRKGMISNEK